MEHAPDHPRHRFFAPDLAAPAAELSGPEAHHALHVLRLRAGQVVELFDGRGRWAAGPITQARRDRLTVAVESVQGPADRPRPIVHLACAVPKGKRLDWLLEKAAELGAASIQPLNCRFSAVTAERGDAVPPRWQAVCAAAVRQSRQLFLPEILPAISAEQVFATAPRGVGLLADCGEGSLRLAEAYDRAADPLHLLVGPEGGWSDDERRAARAGGFVAVRLGGSTLRVETAAVALLAAVTALWRGAD